jgi:hypothetical protein
MSLWERFWEKMVGAGLLKLKATKAFKDYIRLRIYGFSRKAQWSHRLCYHMSILSPTLLTLLSNDGFTS